MDEPASDGAFRQTDGTDTRDGVVMSEPSVRRPGASDTPMASTLGE